MVTSRCIIILLCLLSFFNFHRSVGQSLRSDVKKISSAYAVSKSTTVDVSNKYGRVVINTWDLDSVVINVDVTAYERSYDAIGKLLDRVSIDVNYFGGFVTARTYLDRSSGLIKERWNSFSDDSRALVSKNKISIDYEIYMPIGSTLILENKFGDVFVDGSLNSSKITLAHGDLRAHDFVGLTRMWLSFGKADIRSIEQGFLVMNSSQMEIQEAGELDLESTSSEVNIGDLNELQLISRNDHIILKNVKSLSGSSRFTDIKMEKLEKYLNLNLKFGEIMVTQIDSRFSDINLMSDAGDINLTFGSDSYTSMHLSGRQDKLYLSKDLLKLNRKVIDEKNGIISLTGNAGKEKSTKSTVNIESDSGEIFVYLSSN